MAALFAIKKSTSKCYCCHSAATLYIFCSLWGCACYDFVCRCLCLHAAPYSLAIITAFAYIYIYCILFHCHLYNLWNVFSYSCIIFDTIQIVLRNLVSEGVEGGNIIVKLSYRLHVVGLEVNIVTVRIQHPEYYCYVIYKCKNTVLTMKILISTL